VEQLSRFLECCEVLRETELALLMLTITPKSSPVLFTTKSPI